MKILPAILAVFGDTEAMVQGANVCDKAYACGTGNPGWYTPFTSDTPERVAQNVAGIQTVVSGIGVLAGLRGAKTPEEVDEMALAVLNDIARNDLSDLERDIMHRLANCAWGAGQAFRTDKGPLGRMKNMNVFDLLDADDVEKDLHQFTAAAKWLLEKLSEKK